MDPSGEGLQVQNTGVSMQDYLRQKEELRRLKGIIEAAERSMDFQLAGQMQPTLSAVPHQAVALGPYIYPPGSLPALSLSVPRPSSPMAQETARIVEIESHPSSSNQTSNVSAYKLTNNTESYQGYAQPGHTNPTGIGPPNVFSQPGPSNAHNSQQPLSSMNYTYERPVQPSSSQYNQPLINPHSQVAISQRNQPPIYNNHNGSIRALHGHQEGLYPMRTLQSSSSTAKQYYAQDQFVTESVNQMQVSGLQRTLPNGEAPSMQNRDYVPPHGNFGYAPPQGTFGSQISHISQLSRGTTNTPEQSTSTSIGIPGRKTPMPMSHIMSGTGTTPVFNRSHQESAPPRLQGIPGPMDDAEVPSAPAQLPSSLNDPSFIQPTSSNLSSSYVEPVNTGAPSSTIPAGQTDTNAAKTSQLPALSVLTELLASHEQWREEASSRIIKQTMGSHNFSETVREDESIDNQSSIRLNAVASSSQSLETQQVSRTVVSSSDIQEPQSSTLHARVPPSMAENDYFIEKADVGTAKSMQETSEANTRSIPREPIPHTSSMAHGDGVPYVSTAGPSLPRTPIRGDSPGRSTPGSASADRKTLAKDILRALLPPSTKRKRDGVDTCKGTGLTTNHPVDSPAKRNKTSIPDVPQEPNRSLINGHVATHENQELRRTPMTTPSGAPLAQPYVLPVPFQGTDLQQAASRQFLFSSPQQHPAPPQLAGPSRMMTEGTIPSQQPGQLWAPGSWRTVSASQYAPYHQHYQPPWEAGIWPPISQPSNSVFHHRISQMGPPPRSGSSHKQSRAKPPLTKEQLMTKQPLFLPSSESPPASPNVTPSQTKRVLQEVGRGISLPKSKPIVEIPSPRAISKTAAFSPALLDANTSGEMFGRPTGALAAASAAIPLVGARPSRSRPYVLVPQVDKSLWLVSAHGQTRSYKGKARDSLRMQSGVDTLPDDDEEENEDRARDFAQRLVRRPCLWKDCQAMLDSGEKLTKHVKIVHGKENENMLYVCRWKECQSTRAFPDSEKLIRHLQWHVRNRIYCGYRGCGFQTQLAVQLKVHVTEYHSDRDRLRPHAVPFGLLMPHGLPKLVDDILPTYMSVPIPVAPREISRDRHQKIGPWVLRNIFGKVAINKGAVNAAVPLRSQRLLEKQEYSVPRDEPYQQVQRKSNPRDEYEFLKKEGATKSFAPLALLPLTIDDLEVTEETEELDPHNAEPSKPETSVDVVGDSVIQDPARFEGAARGGSEQLGLTAAMDVETAETVPSGVALNPAHEADEVEGLL